ncbi:IU-nuc-hydro domain-containing protein [Aphelenchoides bicaudatus]|nr:IU-nuc-hydro domain-containing protein [Aphelenchoides bicaudatus]
MSTAQKITVFLFFIVSFVYNADSSHLHTSGERIKMVLDTDGVSDDIQALTMALNHPLVDLVLITTVAGSTTALQAVANVARTLRANQVKKDIPICLGSETALIGNINTTESVTGFFGKDGISDRPMSKPKSRQQDKTSYQKDVHAAEALVKLFGKYPGEITLVAIGPLTNLAMALELNPEFANWPKKVVITGGNLYGMGNIQTASTAEYNFNSDPEAASMVLQRMKCNISLVAWETTFFFQDMFNQNFNFEHHLNLDYPMARYLNAITSKPREVMATFGSPFRYCDEIAMAVAIDHDSIVTKNKKIPVAVELHGLMTRGQLVVGWLHDWLRNHTLPMTPVELILDYNFHNVDRMLINAIKKVPKNEDEEEEYDRDDEDKKR